MADYEDHFIYKKPHEYTLEEKAQFFDKMWEITKAYYDHYEQYGGNNKDEEIKFREQLKQLATRMVFLDATEEDILGHIDELEEEDE